MRSMILAIILDVMHYGSNAYYNRDKIPGYNAPAGKQPM